MSASEDTTDAVADCSHAWVVGELHVYCRLCKVPYHSSTRVHELEARIDDLEAKLAAVTRERDAACYAALEMRDTIANQRRAIDAVRAFKDSHQLAGANVHHLQYALGQALAFVDGKDG